MKGASPNQAVRAMGILSLGGLVIGSALSVGTVHVPVVLTVSAFAIVATTLLLYVERSAVRRLPAPALILMALAAWSALQAVPLPLPVLKVIAPRNADVWARALRPFGEAPLSLGSISLDPGASCVEALKWFVYALTFTLAHRFGRVASGRAGLAVAFVSAVVVSLVTLVHGLIGATSLYGVYTPEVVTSRWGISPILNPNNLSGYLNIGAFCGVGLLLANRAGDERPSAATRAVIGAGIAVVVAVSVLAASRGGVLGLGAGIVILAVLQPLLRKRFRNGDRDSSRSRSRGVLPGVVAMGGGILLAAVGASPTTWAELKQSSTEKIRLWEWSLPLVRDFPWFGVGRGAFGTVFPAYRGLAGHVVFNHAENFILQWFSEWGIPAALAALVGLTWLCRPSAAELARDRAKLAAYVGVGVLLFQNLVDLALEIPAIAILLFTVLASMWEPPPHPSSDVVVERERASLGQTFRRLRRAILGRGARRALAYGIFVGGALAFGLAFAFGQYPADDERAEMHQVYEKTAFGPPYILTAFLGRLRQAVLRHPAEPYFPLLGAIAAERTHEASVLPWIVAALERDMLNARAHLVLASVLLRNHAVDQGLMELRFAVQYDAGLATTAGALAGRSTHDLEKLDRTAPSGGPGSSMLLTTAMAIPAGEDPELRAKLLDLAVARDPTLVIARTARAQELLLAISRKTPPCAVETQTDCLERIREEADAIAKLDPSSCVPVSLKAQILGIEGDLAKGEALLARECASCSDQARCTEERVSLASKLAPTEPFIIAARAFISAACTDEERCLRAHMLVGDLYARRGIWTVAVEHYQEAASKGRNAEWWLRTADASLKGGQLSRASLALARARRDGAGDTALELRIEAIQAEVTASESVLK